MGENSENQLIRIGIIPKQEMSEDLSCPFWKSAFLWLTTSELKKIKRK